ncbi:hypothetical protein FHQ18_09380 [Deferribacter autotrophicus]|uniref:Uncharacterized protein n=1 Tax=Deferribacter autotrophicus TaxID=500465 RepID=A0A5A8F3I2_9BACT|nr:hypothetical protein [Deferribacter autotrophicus]KAA0257544.1 hypothetical protein FHQ18_09380 [Deferribacter autotrophicus]
MLTAVNELNKIKAKDIKKFLDSINLSLKVNKKPHSLSSTYTIVDKKGYPVFYGNYNAFIKFICSLNYILNYVRTNNINERMN